MVSARVCVCVCVEGRADSSGRSRGVILPARSTRITVIPHSGFNGDLRMCPYSHNIQARDSGHVTSRSGQKMPLVNLQLVSLHVAQSQLVKPLEW